MTDMRREIERILERPADFDCCCDADLRRVLTKVSRLAYQEAAEVAIRQRKKYQGPQGQSVMGMEGNRRSAETCTEIAAAILRLGEEGK
jgi:hypothetical protein